MIIELEFSNGFIRFNGRLIFEPSLLKKIVDTIATYRQITKGSLFFVCVAKFMPGWDF